jgi:type IX secretion system PorP/SprF family membrane protein
MTSLRTLAIFILFQVLVSQAVAQQNLIYNHYFLSPYLLNPSFIAPNGYTELNLNTRKQWAQFEGAPTTITANLQVPINYKMGFAVNVYNDQAGVLQTNTGAASFAYQVYLGKSTDVNHKLGFGLSMGYSMSRVDMSKIDDPNDPSLNNSNTSNLDGQFGMHYQFNNLKIGFALPSLFYSKAISEDAFNTPKFDALKNTFTSISYNFKVSNRIAFEPYVMYRTNEIKQPQVEVLGTLKVDNLLWVGGSYRVDYGPAALLGFSLKEKIKIGYAYEFAPKIADGFGTGSHELHISVRLGKKQVSRPAATPTVTEEPVTEKVIEKTQPKEERVEPKPVVEEPKKEVVEEPKKEVVEEPKKEVVEEPKKETVVQPVVAEPEQPKEKVVTLNGRGLKPGHYVVVGAFRSNQNALALMNNLKKEGYQATVSYSPVKEYYYVHMGNLASLDEAKKLRDDYRKENKFSLKDTWILTIE